jgi:hypothetical protein
LRCSEARAGGGSGGEGEAEKDEGEDEQACELLWCSGLRQTEEELAEGGMVEGEQQSRRCGRACDELQRYIAVSCCLLSAQAGRLTFSECSAGQQRARGANGLS